MNDNIRSTRRRSWQLLGIVGVIAFIAGVVLLVTGWMWGLLIALLGATCATSAWNASRRR